MIYLFLSNIVSAILIFFAYYLGLVNGQKIQREEKVSIPNLRERKEEKEMQKKQNKEMEKLETIMSNIDAFDGTPNGQKDIPI